MADVILERRCVGCTMAPTILCHDCWTELLSLGPQVSAVPLNPAAATAATIVASAGPYRDLMRRLVLAHKDQAVRALTRPLGVTLARAIAALTEDETTSTTPLVIVPIPPHDSSLRRRGEDTVATVARASIAALRTIGIRAEFTPALRRRPGSVQQIGASAEQRRTRQVESMTIRSTRWPAQPATLVVVDDVLTTGATCGEAIRVLGTRRPDLLPFRVAVLAHAQVDTDAGTLGQQH